MDVRRAVRTSLVIAASVAMFSPGSAPANDRDDDAGAEPPVAVQPPRGVRIQPQRPDRILREMLIDVDHRRTEATIRKLVTFGTRHTLSSQTDPVRGIGAATNWVFETLQGYAAASDGRMTVEKQTFIQPAGPRIPAPVSITNVIVTIKGQTNPERVYVMSGHIDSRVTDVLSPEAEEPGADDDASGVAVIMETARVLSKHRPDATVILAVVAGEEQGTFGSVFLAAQLKAANTDVQGDYSFDIVGNSLSDGNVRDAHIIRLFAEGVPTVETPLQVAFRQNIGGENDGPSRQLARFSKSVAENELTDMRIWIIYRRDRYLRGSDQIPFLQQGYPANRYTEPNENFAHEHQDVRVENGVQFGDLPQFVDFHYVGRVAKVAVSTIWSLAEGPGTPKNVIIVTTELTNTTRLTWDRGADTDLAGYEVVWRHTTDADWTNVIPVGDVTAAAFPNSPKDNFQFGVRAVDKDGHRSPAGFPHP